MCCILNLFSAPHYFDLLLLITIQPLTKQKGHPVPAMYFKVFKSSICSPCIYSALSAFESSFINHNMTLSSSTRCITIYSSPCSVLRHVIFINHTTFKHLRCIVFSYQTHFQKVLLWPLVSSTNICLKVTRNIKECMGEGQLMLYKMLKCLIWHN